MEFTNLESQPETPKRNYSSTADINDAPPAEPQPISKNATTTRKRGVCSTLKYDDSYIRRFWEGRLKIFELITSLIAMLVLPNVTEYYALRFIFFRIVATTTFCCVALDLLLHLSSQWERLCDTFKSSRFILGMTLIAVACFLGTTSLVIVVADVSDNEHGVLVASLCGYLCMMSFVLESVLYFLKIRSESLYRVD